MALATIPSATLHAQAEAPQPHLIRPEIQKYHQVQALIDWVTEKLQGLPELQGLQPARSQDELPAILRTTGERVSALFEDLPNLASTEQVQSGPCKTDLSDTCRVTFRGKFNYLVVTRPTEDGQVMGEFRTDEKGRPIDYQHLGRGRILLTYGFTTTPLQHFEAQNRTACRFRYLGRQLVHGRETDVVGFAEIAGQYPHPTELHQRGAVVPVFLQGLAWIDATAYRVVRIETQLLAVPPDVDLEKETTLVEFGEIPLRGASTAFWLPTEVVVDAWVHQRHLRNVHRYSHFKVFTVETRIGPPVEK